MISAASHRVVFFAIAFNSTSCSFTLRPNSALEYGRLSVTDPASRTPDLPADRSSVNWTGQITC